METFQNDEAKDTVLVTNDNEVSAGTAVTRLLEGAAPECIDDILLLWNLHKPQVELTQDTFGFSLEGKAYNILKFNHKSMCCIWLHGFAAQQAFIRYSGTLVYSQINKIPINHSKLEELAGIVGTDYKVPEIITAISSLQNTDDISYFDWPHYIPKPQNGKPKDIHGMMVFDLLCIGGAFCFLHEFKHIMLNNENLEHSLHEEELLCDKFAYITILTNIEKYTSKTKEPLKAVMSKRLMAIFLVYTLLFVIQNNWGETNTHPSIFKRLEQFISVLNIDNNDGSWLYLSCILIAFCKTNGIAFGDFVIENQKAFAIHILNALRSIT